MEGAGCRRVMMWKTSTPEGALGGNAAQAGGGGTAYGPEVVKTLSERQWPELRKETWRSHECQPRRLHFSLDTW